MHKKTLYIIHICKVSKSHFIIVFLQKFKRLKSKNHYGEFYLRSQHFAFNYLSINSVREHVHEEAVNIFLYKEHRALALVLSLHTLLIYHEVNGLR